VLSALEFGLSTSAKPTEQDFFAHRSSGDDELWVQMTFSDLTEQEMNTFKRYVLSDGTVCIRKTARLSDGTVDSYYNGWLEESDEEWLQAGNASKYTTRDKVSQTPLAELVPDSGRITKSNIIDAQANYIEQHHAELNFSKSLESGPLLGQKNVGGGVLPEFFLIPAVRDLTDEIKIKTTTSFGRLMNRAVREMAERDERFIEARTQLETVIQSLNARDGGQTDTNELVVLERGIERELSAWGVTVNIQVTPPVIEKLFELGTDIHLDDGVRTTADRKGHGLQRAMMFALLRSWAAALRAERQVNDDSDVSARRQSDSVIFAMEEPELFLHPHAQRRLSTSLREISETPEHQVFLCTHSTHFVDLAHYKEIVIISKDDAVRGSEVRQCSDELFESDGVDDQKKRFHMAEWINPDRSEMFFARKVVFVEGETEKVVIPYLGEKLNTFDPDVSIIDCGSKHNLPLYITIAKAFGIPYLVVHDEDPLPDPIPDNWGEDKIASKRRTFGLNQTISDLVDAPFGSIEVMSPDFERVAGVSKSQGDRKGKALAALDFFYGVPPEDIPDRIKELVSASFGDLTADGETDTAVEAEAAVASR
jgi:CRISPR-associated exonuclease Cas4